MAGSDLVLDAALKKAGEDRFDHEAIAGVVADLASNATPPINIALFGPWGSGKSSFFGLLNERLNEFDNKVSVVRYDAWKYGGRALKKHFVGSVARKLDLGGDDFDESLAHDQEHIRLNLGRWVKDNFTNIVVGASIAILISLLWFFLVSIAVWLVDGDSGFNAAMQIAVTSVGTVLSLTFAALLFGPKILDSAVVKVRESAPETDDEFAKSFQHLVNKAVNVNKGERLLVFIDELDRCSPKDVVATLIDLKTFLDINGCVFIVAADREVLERSLSEVPQANPIRDEDPYYSTPGAFLDKIFQHQIPLPPLRPQALTHFARAIVEEQGGLWADLRSAEADDRLLLKVVYALVPVHVRSPRRVKVLLNNYATNVRIAQAREVDWLDRATELAFLTVLETEFPTVASDLVDTPRLLAYLRGENYSSVSKEVRNTVEGYLSSADGSEDRSSNKPEAAEAAGKLLIDTGTHKETTHQANRVLNSQLRSYLLKIAAQDIPDPRPDLFYLQSAGQKDGLADRELGYAIDFAADLAASEVVQTFSGQPSATLAVGVRMLVHQAEAERGPGRSNIIEAACRLIERLDQHDLAAIAPAATGGVLAEVDQPNWSREATPGALLLGVVGAHSALVERLLQRDPVSALAHDGLLSRLSPVLTFANEQQASLVHAMLAEAYYRYPTPLHESLRTLPPDAAQALWNATRERIKNALSDLVAESTGAPPQSPPADSEDDDVPEDTAVERYSALMAAVESRSDRAETLISEVLELGQRSGDGAVRSRVRALEDDALPLITDPVRLNLHALLGLERAPLGDAAFWAEKLTNAETHPAQALRAFTRLTEGLEKSEPGVQKKIATAVSPLLRQLSSSDNVSVVSSLTSIVEDFDWTDENQRGLRDIVYDIVNSARSLLGNAEVDALLSAGIATGLNSSPVANALVEELYERTSNLTVAGAALLEDRIGSEGGDPVAVFRIRVAAASRTTTAIAADDLLALRDLEIDAQPTNEWLALRPPLSDVIRIVGNGLRFNRRALGEYASTLSLADRTALWIHCDDNAFNTATLQAVGDQGIDATAIEHATSKIINATQQAQRDELVTRLLVATLAEHPLHVASTRLVERLLSSGVRGDAVLAARVAIASGGVSRGKSIATKKAFDSVAGANPKTFSKGTQNDLQSINLLSKRKRFRK